MDITKLLSYKNYRLNIQLWFYRSKPQSEKFAEKGIKKIKMGTENAGMGTEKLVQNTKNS